MQLVVSQLVMTHCTCVWTDSEGQLRRKLLIQGIHLAQLALVHALVILTCTSLSSVRYVIVPCLVAMLF